MSTEIEEVEIELAVGDLRLRVAPYGAALRGLWREVPGAGQQEIVTAYTGAKGKIGGQGDVLIPFPGRIREGRYTFDGQTYQMERNDKESPGAIHGFLRHVPWEVAEQSEQSVTFAVTLQAGDHPGYPFPLRATVTYTLEAAGLTCRFALTNSGEQPAPVAAGFHPYFTVGSDTIDGDTLHVPMAATLEFEGLLPTGNVLPVDGTPYDFRQPRPIDTTPLNTCYLHPLRDPDGLLRLSLATPSGDRKVTVWMDAAFDYVVLYSGDPLPESHRRRALAIEPMTCGSDAFNHPEWGLVALEPGQIFAGVWGVTAE
jgi:aldose 1-epimerase